MLLAALAGVLLMAAIAVLLSFDQIDALFKERASFSQPYDSGRFGRFGRHLLGADMALDYPTGIGPLQFRRFFPEDTHNSFLNAFMSGGWISGILYPAAGVHHRRPTACATSSCARRGSVPTSPSSRP